MQVFIPNADPFWTADILDNRRRNKQIIECRQILKAIRGESKAWANHPVTRMYRDYTEKGLVSQELVDELKMR